MPIVAVLTFLVAVDLAPAVEVAAVAIGPSIQRVENVATVGERYVLVHDVYGGRVAVVDVVRGATTQVLETAPLGTFEFSELPELRSAGRFVLVAGGGGWERFELVRGRLEPAGSHVVPPGSWEFYEAAELAPDGKVVALAWTLDDGYVVEVVAADGRTSRTPRPYARLLRTSLSPSGDLLAIAMPEFGRESPLEVWDVADPEAPRTLWSLPYDVAEAAFDPTGTRLLVGGPFDGDAFRVATYDARSGTPLGPPSPEVPKFYYHGLGTQWIADGAWRAIFWRWSYGGWYDAVVELAGPDAGTVVTYDYEGYFPQFAPRESGGWYALRRDPWAKRANVVIGDPAGATAETGFLEGDQEGLAALRRGFFVTVRTAPGPMTVVVWRDASLPPLPVLPREGSGS